VSSTCESREGVGICLEVAVSPDLHRLRYQRWCWKTDVDVPSRSWYLCTFGPTQLSSFSGTVTTVSKLAQNNLAPPSCNQVARFSDSQAYCQGLENYSICFFIRRWLGEHVRLCGSATAKRRPSVLPGRQNFIFLGLILSSTFLVDLLGPWLISQTRKVLDIQDGSLGAADFILQR
jgi:hypothetical protein